MYGKGEVREWLWRGRWLLEYLVIQKHCLGGVVMLKQSAFEGSRNGAGPSCLFFLLWVEIAKV